MMGWSATAESVGLGNRLCPILPPPSRAGRRRPDLWFHLRPDIKYSNGAWCAGGLPPRDRAGLHSTTAAAAAPSSTWFPGTRCPGAQHCDLARGMVANDRAGTVTFHLTAPDPDFLYKLAFPFADAVPAGTPRHLVSPVQLPATGPYVTQSFVPGHRWVLVRNPRFRPWSTRHTQRLPRPDCHAAGYPSRAWCSTGAAWPRRCAPVACPSASSLSWLPATPASCTPVAGGHHRADPQHPHLPSNVLAARRRSTYAVDRNRLIRLIGGPLVGQPTCQILPPAMLGYQPYCPYTVDPGPAGVWTAPNLARAEQLVSTSGTRGAMVTVLTGAFGTQIPDLTTGRYLISVL